MYSSSFHSQFAVVLSDSWRMDPGDILFTITGSLGLTANFIQLILTCRDKDHKTSVFGLVLLSLNIANILVSFTTLLNGVTSLVDHFMVINASLHFYLLSIAKSGNNLSLVSSITHVLFIAIQRMIAVAPPFQVKRILTRSRCYIALLVLWAISITTTVISFFTDVLFAIFLSVFICGMALVVMYSIVAYKTTKRSIGRDESEEMRKRRQKSDKEVLFYSMAVSIVFVICNFPVAITFFVQKKSVLAMMLASICFRLNPFLDTLLYFLWSYNKRRRRAVANNNPPVANLPLRNQGTDMESTNDL